MSAPGKSLARALLCDGPAPDRAGKLGLYAFLVGSWDLELVTHREDGSTFAHRGELHAGWALEGRAIQDVWITPPRRERRAGASASPPLGAWYGSTLRVYDPALDAWHVLWSDPATQLYSHQIGRAEGPDIVQQGELRPGVPLRWSFREIARDSFRWRAEISSDAGAHWRLQVEALARRAGASPG